MNKKQTRLLPVSGKFRKATIDRKDSIFQGCRAALQYKANNTAVPLLINNKQITNKWKYKIVQHEDPTIAYTGKNPKTASYRFARN